MPKDPKWRDLCGNWDVDTAPIRYTGSTPTQVIPYGLARCSRHLSSGDGNIQLDITLTGGVENDGTTGGVVVGFQAIDRPYIGIGLGAFDFGYSIFEFRPEKGWYSIKKAGLLANLRKNSPHNMAVRIRGQNIRLTIDEVDVLDCIIEYPLTGAGVCLYGYGHHEVLFENFRIHSSRPKVFVVMPFKEPYDTVYRELIRRVAKRLRFHVVRVDEIAGPGMIVEDIRSSIAAAHVIVAEITEDNANVFYEIGYAHALNKPTILLIRCNPDEFDGSDRINHLPFDIRGFRAILYDDTIGGSRQLKRDLRKHLKAIRPGR